MFGSWIKAGLPALAATLFLGGAGLAGCASEDFDSMPYTWDEGGPRTGLLYGEPYGAEAGPGLDEGLADGTGMGPGLDEDFYGEDIGPGPGNGLYDDSILPGSDGGLYED